MIEMRDSWSRLCFTVEPIQEQSGWIVRVRSFVRGVKSLDHDCGDEDTARSVTAGFAGKFAEIIQRMEQKLGPEWYEPA